MSSTISFTKIKELPAMCVVCQEFFSEIERQLQQVGTTKQCKCEFHKNCFSKFIYENNCFTTPQLQNKKFYVCPGCFKPLFLKDD
jgi:hypothetical protein